MTDEDEAMATQLLIDRATVGLTTAQQAELGGLLQHHPDLDDESFELAAAAIDLAHTIPDQPMPAALRQRVAAQAEEFFETQKSSTTTTSKVEPFPDRSSETVSTTGSGSGLGWLAAAACLALAIAGWWPRNPAPPVLAASTSSESPPQSAPPQSAPPQSAPPQSALPQSAPPVQAPSPAQTRAALIAEGGELIRLDWTATEDPAAASAGGDVIWSNTQQTGFMRFTGLPVNDPSVEQYQLWIFDTQQDERYPVDGGVFDVTSAEETVIEINSKLQIAEPTLFAITIEKPGGVVVSSRERLPLLAQVS